MKQVEYYEVAGAVVPGVVLLLAADLIWPGYMTRVPKLDITFGGFGLFVIIAYVAGQVLQTIGNLLESIWWRIMGGWPSDWIRNGKSDLLSKAQLAKLQDRIRKDFGYEDFAFASDLLATEWRPVFRQIYAAVHAAGRDGRAYVFNGNYGMFRGVVAACLIAAIASVLVRGREAWPMSVAFLTVAILSVYRMHRFAVHYARETLVQFLSLPQPGKPEKKSEE